MQSEEKALVRLAAEIARRAHEGQVDKAGRPYFDSHVADVHRRVEEYGGDVYEQVAALLHDVVEDTDVTLELLAHRGMPPPALEIVALLTHAEGVPDEEYWAAIKAHEPARRVKVHGDLASNSDPVRLAQLDDVTRERLEAKYARAKAALAD